MSVKKSILKETSFELLSQSGYIRWKEFSTNRRKCNKYPENVEISYSNNQTKDELITHN